MDKSVPNDVLAIADRIRFGAKRPLQAARETLLQIEEDLGGNGNSSWNAESVSLYAKNQVTFVVTGKRFRKDRTLGKLNETMTFSFESKGKT